MGVFTAEVKPEGEAFAESTAKVLCAQASCTNKQNVIKNINPNKLERHETRISRELEKDKKGKDMNE